LDFNIKEKIYISLGDSPDGFSHAKDLTDSKKLTGKQSVGLSKKGTTPTGKFVVNGSPKTNGTCGDYKRDNEKISRTNKLLNIEKNHGLFHL
jgi:hypothetical protein